MKVRKNYRIILIALCFCAISIKSEKDDENSSEVKEDEGLIKPKRKEEKSINNGNSENKDKNQRAKRFQDLRTYQDLIARMNIEIED